MSQEVAVLERKEVQVQKEELVEIRTSPTLVEEIRAPELKKYAKPTGKLSTGNIGINDLLNPKKEIEDEFDEENFTPTNKEPFEFTELERLWKEYALSLKRKNRDNLHSTLMNSVLSMTSDYKITLIIDNSIQSVELEREKSSLIGFLRSKLKNDFLSFEFKISESTKVALVDSKSNFEKMAEENPSLHKFRKLFSLDVEF